MTHSLVLGGAGFVGSHLVDALLARGDRVTVLDNLFTGRRENLAHVADRVEFVRHDVCEPFHFDGVDVVYALACPASPRAYQLHPARTIETGVLGTLNALKFCRDVGARMVFTSTSEIYGDPQVHPQPETYWGHVNPVGERSCYDESKRCAESLCWAWREQHGVDVRVARLFNSVLADESVLYDDGTELRRETAREAAARLGLKRGDKQLVTVRVPAFSRGESRIWPEVASWMVAHPPTGKCYEIRTRYGRKVRVTGDHSVFVRGRNGEPIAKLASSIHRGESIAIASRIRVPERDRLSLDVSALLETKCDPFDVLIQGEDLSEVAWERRQILKDALLAAGRAKATASTPAENIAWSELRRRRDLGNTSMWALRVLGLGVPFGSRVNLRGGSSDIPARVDVSDDLLWLLGLFVGDGVLGHYDGDHVVVWSSSDESCDRASEIIGRVFGLHVTRVPRVPGRIASIRVSSKPLSLLLEALGFNSDERRVPGWILSLPLSRLGHFLSGFRWADGVRSGKTLGEGKRHDFSTISEPLKDDLLVAFARFGLVASVGKYTTENQEPGRSYEFWRLTLCNVSPWDPTRWASGVSQALNATRTGDLVWAGVREVVEVEPTDLVYDFTVPGSENFYAGSGVMCHNTYGPRMAEDDGRVVSSFVTRALRGEKLEVYGRGEQTRSFCYVSDTVAALVEMGSFSTRVLPGSELGLPVLNIGNPDERTILGLAHDVLDAVGVSPPHHAAMIAYRDLPRDDPRQRCPDITRARAVLGWAPRVDYLTGIRSTVRWWRERFGMVMTGESPVGE